MVNHVCVKFSDLSCCIDIYPHMQIGKVWIFRLLFLWVFVCTVTDLSAEDKASGVKFLLAVHQRPTQEIAHFCELCSSRRTNRSARGPRPPVCEHYRSDAIMRPRKRHARDAPFVEYRTACDVGSACVDTGPSPLTYLLKYRVKDRHADHPTHVHEYTAGVSNYNCVACISILWMHSQRRSIVEISISIIFSFFHNLRNTHVTYLPVFNLRDNLKPYTENGGCSPEGATCFYCFTDVVKFEAQESTFTWLPYEKI